MPEYQVNWAIDISADSPLEAAQKALEIQRNPVSIATVFELEERGASNSWWIDLTPEVDVSPDPIVIQQT